MGRNENFPQRPIISFSSVNIVSRKRKQALCTFYVDVIRASSAEKRSDCQTDSQVPLNESREIFVSLLTSDYGESDVKFAFC